jgi:hypothetical protein
VSSSRRVVRRFGEGTAQGAGRGLPDHPGEVPGRGDRLDAKAPFQDTTIELRQVFELSDFGDNPAIDLHQELAEQLKGR